MPRETIYVEGNPGINPTISFVYFFFSVLFCKSTWPVCSQWMPSPVIHVFLQWYEHGSEWNMSESSSRNLFRKEYGGMESWFFSIFSFLSFRLFEGEWKLFGAQICKLLRSPGIDSKESIPPASVMSRASTTTLFVVLPARLHRLAESIPWNRFLGSLKVYKFSLWCTVSMNWWLFKSKF
jgi:hypothetical protein